MLAVDPLLIKNIGNVMIWVGLGIVVIALIVGLVKKLRKKP